MKKLIVFECRDCAKTFEDLVEDRLEKPDCPRCGNRNTRPTEGIQYDPSGWTQHHTWRVRR